MSDISYYIQTLGNTILNQYISKSSTPDFGGIILLNNQSRLLENYIYVGHFEDGIRILNQCDSTQTVTLFLSANVHDSEVCEGRTFTPHNVILSTLDIIDIYNRINIMVDSRRSWINHLQVASLTETSLQFFIRRISDFLNLSIFVLNPGFRCLAANITEPLSDPIGSALVSSGCLSADCQALLANTFSRDKSCCKITLQDCHYYFQKIQVHGVLTAYLLLLDHGTLPSYTDRKQLLIEISDAVSMYLRESQLDLLSQDLVFSSFIRDVFEEKLIDESEFVKRSARLACPLQTFLALILIEFDESEKTPPYEVFLHELQNLFPNTNSTVYQKKIVLLFTQKERPLHRLDFDYDAFSHLLEEYHARAGISNASRHLNRLRSLWLIADSTIRLGCRLHRFSPNERMFIYEDYSMYYIIDLAARKYLETHHNDDLIYLTHPSVIRICRYDKAHNTNLRDVLFYYLLCGCSLTKTAQTMYMHRNTILNKLNKITEITEIPLNDGYTQQRIIISCLVMRYYEEYLHQSIQL